MHRCRNLKVRATTTTGGVAIAPGIIIRPVWRRRSICRRRAAQCPRFVRQTSCCRVAPATGRRTTHLAIFQRASRTRDIICCANISFEMCAHVLLRCAIIVNIGLCLALSHTPALTRRIIRQYVLADVSRRVFNWLSPDTSIYFPLVDCRSFAVRPQSTLSSPPFRTPDRRSQFQVAPSCAVWRGSIQWMDQL